MTISKMGHNFFQKHESHYTKSQNVKMTVSNEL